MTLEKGDSRFVEERRLLTGLSQPLRDVGFVLIGDGPVYPIVGLLLGRG